MDHQNSGIGIMKSSSFNFINLPRPIIIDISQDENNSKIPSAINPVPILIDLTDDDDDEGHFTNKPVQLSTLTSSSKPSTSVPKPMMTFNESRENNSNCVSELSISPFNNASKVTFTGVSVPKANESLREYTLSLLNKSIEIQLPSMQSAESDRFKYTAHKIAWWVLKNQLDLADVGLIHPELHDAEIDGHNMNLVENEEDVENLSEYMSDSDGCNDKVSNGVPDPDLLDEYCGLATLGATVRRPFTTLEEQNMRYVFKVKPGTNYEKTALEVKCFCCDTIIKGQRALGIHVRSTDHKENFGKLSLNMGLAQYKETINKCMFPSDCGFAARLEKYTEGDLKNIEDDLPQIKEDESCSSKKVTDLVNAQHPDVPMNVDVDNKWLPTFEEFNITEDHAQIDMKLKLRVLGKWTNNLESKWKKMKEEEKKIIDDYDEKRKLYLSDPVSHPRYQLEWSKFWTKRSAELISQGKNPSLHDFKKEWVRYWSRGIQGILKFEAEEMICKMKVEVELDTESLKKLERSGMANQRNFHRIPGVQKTIQRNNYPENRNGYYNQRSNRIYQPVFPSGRNHRRRNRGPRGHGRNIFHDLR